MRIALDYDQTYTLDPTFWNAFIQMLYASRGDHEVCIVTVRDRNLDRTAELVKLERKVKVIYTAGVAKRWFLSHFGEGFVPDIWIDDKPESILYNSPTTPADLVIWRTARGEGDTVVPG